MFYPAHKRLVRFRYESEKTENKFSFLDSSGSEFILKDLNNYLNWKISFSIINWKTDEIHEHLKLYIRNSQYQIVDRKVTGRIQTKEIRLDFIGIERIKNSVLGHTKDKKSQSNCRLLAELVNENNFQKIETRSHIIRNKGNKGNEELIIASKGMPKFALDWTTLVITLEKSVPFYLEEVQLKIGETIVSTSTKEVDKLRNKVFKFSIPQEIEKRVGPLNCCLMCRDFNKSDSFQWLPENICNRKLSKEKPAYLNQNDEDDIILNGPLSKVARLDETAKSSNAENIEFEIDDNPNNDQVQHNRLSYDGELSFDESLDKYFPLNNESEWTVKEYTDLLNSYQSNSNISDTDSAKNK